MAAAKEETHVKDDDKTKEQPIGELEELRQKIIDLELREADRLHKEKELEKYRKHLEKQTEQLRQSEDRFSKAFRCNPDPIVITDLRNGRCIEVNDAFIEASGYDRNEVIGNSNTEMGIWSDPRECNLVLKLLQEQGNIRDFEAHFRIKNGEIRTVLLSADIVLLEGEPSILTISKDITERKRMEKQLQEERNLNAALLDSAGDLITVSDQEGRIVRFNQACEQAIGYTFDEVKGKYLWDVVIAPEDIKTVKSLFSENTINGNSTCLAQKFEKHWLTKDGDRRLIRWTITFLWDEGSTPYIIGTGTDVTDQRIMEDRLRKSEAEMRSLLQNASGIIYTMSPEGRFIYVSPSWKEILGNDLAEVQGQSFEQLVHPDDLHQCRIFFESVIFTGEAQKGVEFRVKHSDGTWLFLTTSTAPVKDEVGNILYFVGVALDINDRKQAEKALRESELRFREMLYNIKMVAFILDQQGQLAFCNEYFLHLSGWKREEAIGQNWGELFLPEDIRERDMRIINRSLEQKKAPSYGESELQTKTGERKTILWNNILLSSDDNAGFASIGEDITERRAAEKINQELMLKLRSTNRELKDFAYIVSHDLKAPLRGIKSLAEWLYSDYADKFDEEGKEQLTLMLNRTKRMHNLLEGILMYSRLSQKREENTNIDLNEVMLEAIEMLNPPGNISIVMKDNLPSLILERTRIHQVFVNLIDNAIKYMDKADGQIIISCRKQGEYWQFSVQDNGCGIESRHFERIFTIFQTLKPRDEIESTGIGLTIVKKIVELYGGKIWVESKVGEGSIFHFTLPTFQK